MKYCFIINPASGKSATKEGLEQRILDAGVARGLDVSVFVTERAGDACDHVRDFWRANPDEDIRFYVCGGDGTLCEVVNGIMSLEDRSRVSFGVVPIGTGNDFVRNFTQKDRFFDIDAQLDATEIEIDVMKCNDLYSVNMINIGFDCQVVVKTDKYKRHKLVPSKMAYILGLLATIIKKPGTSVSVRKDSGEAVKKELLLTTFANGCFCGGGFKSNPNASLCDGSIDAIYIKNISRIKFITLVGQYKAGTHLDGSLEHIITTDKAQSYSLEFSEPTRICIDGELVVVDRADISCVRGALRALVPAGCEYSGLTAAEECAVL